jgi:hypothetical protein
VYPTIVRIEGNSWQKYFSTPQKQPAANVATWLPLGVKLDAEFGTSVDVMLAGDVEKAAANRLKKDIIYFRAFNARISGRWNTMTSDI